MQYSTLGQTDLKVSKICLGTMTFGEQNTEADGHAQLDYALSRGVNFIDTAEMYPVPGRAETQGATERIIGTWLTARKNRDQVILATKIIGPAAAFPYVRPTLDFKPASIRAAVETSLQRLQTDYIDLYQLHWPERRSNMFGIRGYPADPNDPWQDNMLEVLHTMQELVDAGKIRHFGVSNETPWGLQRFIHLAEIHGLPRCVSIQNPYSLLNRLFEIGLSEVAIREHAGLLAYSPLAFGVLSGKYEKGTADDRSRLVLFGSNNRLVRYNGAVTRKATAAYVRIAEEHGLSPAQMALAFVNTRPFVTSNIIGATTLEQLKENIDSIDVTLSKEVQQAIEAVHREMPDPAP